MSMHHGSRRDRSSPLPRSNFISDIGLPLRRLAIAAAAMLTVVLGTAGMARAAVEITIDKDNQQMTVAVDGTARYRWPVSSGVPSHETPNGTFRAFRMEADHYSKEWDDAPMPHSIFFTKIGHAIHGTDSVGRLGSPASHGCVRLSRANAATLYALVEQQGVLNTTVTLTGSSQVAIARGRGQTQVARGDGSGDPMQIAPRADAASYGAPDSAANADVQYVDRYGRPLDLVQLPNGRKVYRLRPQNVQADADPYGRPPASNQPRGPLFDLFRQ